MSPFIQREREREREREKEQAIIKCVKQQISCCLLLFVVPKPIFSFHPVVFIWDTQQNVPTPLYINCDAPPPPPPPPPLFLKEIIVLEFDTTVWREREREKGGRCMCVCVGGRLPPPPPPPPLGALGKQQQQDYFCQSSFSLLLSWKKDMTRGYFILYFVSFKW